MSVGWRKNYHENIRKQKKKVPFKNPNSICYTYHSSSFFLISQLLMMSNSSFSLSSSFLFPLLIFSTPSLSIPLLLVPSCRFLTLLFNHFSSCFNTSCSWSCCETLLKFNCRWSPVIIFDWNLFLSILEKQHHELWMGYKVYSRSFNWRHDSIEVIRFKSKSKRKKTFSLKLYSLVKVKQGIEWWMTWVWNVWKTRKFTNELVSIVIINY